jgi:hypothetical protein
MATTDVIEAAITGHGAWRTILQHAIETGTSSVDIARAKRDDRCELGKWLYREADARDRRSPSYARVRELHQAFHVEAARVLDLALQGRKPEAEAAMAMRSPYASASAALSAALKAWREGVGIGV